MTELKSCPFCGDKAQLHASYDMDTGEVDGWFAWCNNDRCECKPETNEYFTEAGAIDAWNNRAERTCHWKLEHSGTLYDKWRCSKCGYLYVESRTDGGATDLDPNYCPNCGAKVVDE